MCIHIDMPIYISASTHGLQYRILSDKNGPDTKRLRRPIQSTMDQPFVAENVDVHPVLIPMRAIPSIVENTPGNWRVTQNSTITPVGQCDF